MHTRCAKFSSLIFILNTNSIRSKLFLQADHYFFLASVASNCTDNSVVQFYATLCSSFCMLLFCSSFSTMTTGRNLNITPFVMEISLRSCMPLNPGPPTNYLISCKVSRVFQRVWLIFFRLSFQSL